jgi:hypothetical protein
MLVSLISRFLAKGDWDGSDRTYMYIHYSPALTQVQHHSIDLYTTSISRFDFDFG